MHLPHSLRHHSHHDAPLLAETDIAAARAISEKRELESRGPSFQKRPWLPIRKLFFPQKRLLLPKLKRRLVPTQKRPVLPVVTFLTWEELHARLGLVALLPRLHQPIRALTLSSMTRLCEKHLEKWSFRARCKEC
eukprot:1583674-Amphidinium_carterae.1